MWEETFLIEIITRFFFEVERHVKMQKVNDANDVGEPIEGGVVNIAI